MIMESRNITYFSSDGEVTWSELTEFLLLGFEEEVHRSEQILLEPPIVSAPKMFKTHHRQAISKICFSPAILPVRSKFEMFAEQKSFSVFLG